MWQDRESLCQNKKHTKKQKIHYVRLLAKVQVISQSVIEILVPTFVVCWGNICVVPEDVACVSSNEDMFANSSQH